MSGEPAVQAHGQALEVADEGFGGFALDQLLLRGAAGIELDIDNTHAPLAGPPVATR